MVKLALLAIQIRDMKMYNPYAALWLAGPFALPLIAIGTMYAVAQVAFNIGTGPEITSDRLGKLGRPY